MKEQQQKTYGTERLLLSPLSKADLAELHKLHSDPHVMKYIREPEKNLDETRLSLERMIAHAQKNPGMGFWKLLTKEDHDFVGWIGLFPLELTTDIELGYRLKQKYWGRGYTLEAASYLLKYLHSELQIPQCVAVINPENTPSRNVLEKLGFSTLGKAQHYNIEVEKFALQISALKETSPSSEPVLEKTKI